MRALVVGITVAGCATEPAVTCDYDTTADFAALKTFSWMPATGNAAGDELLVKKIKNAVDAELQAKGRAPAEASPDFLIGMRLSGRTTYGGSTAVGVSVSIPVGRAGRASVGGTKSQPSEKTEGTLVLDFVDGKTRSLLWRATASGAINPAASPEAQQERINAAIAEMLAYFPPRR